MKGRGSGPWQVCFGSQTSCHPVCSEGHLSQLEKGHCARGHSVAFTPDRALGGTATGSRRMAASLGCWAVAKRPEQNAMRGLVSEHASGALLRQSRNN